MEPLIGREEESDPRSIQLATREDTYIPNEQLDQWSPEEMQAALELVEAGTDDAKSRSAASTYNCVGHVFAERRTKIEPRHVDRILREDGYRRVQNRANVYVGDIVVYENGHGTEIAHVGEIVEVRPNLEDGTRTLMVLSQFGRNGEWLHEEHDVPEGCGTPERYYTERQERP